MTLCRLFHAFALLMLLAPAAVAARDKTDTVFFTNGDRLTGEILSLDYGQLKVKTDALGTVAIEWPKVSGVQSDHHFLVECLDGRKRVGTLDGTDGSLRIAEDGAAESIPLAEIKQLGPAEPHFRDRLTGSIAVGFNFANSTNIKTSNFRLDTLYRAPHTVKSLSVSEDVTSNPGSGDNQRLRVDYNDRHLLKDSRFLMGLATFERIAELGINGRLQAGIAAGTSVVQRVDQNVAGYVGLAVNEEWAKSTDASTTSVEGVLGLDWRIYRFSKPELTLHSTLIAYPSLSDSGRLRSRLDTSVSHKLAGDFTLTLSVYDDYDNRPPGHTTSTNDYGMATALGYTF